MGIIAEGKLYLTQDNEKIKHINLELVSDFINKLHNTRRLYRIVNKPKFKNIYNNYLKYPEDAYGVKGQYFYHDENHYKESIEDYNMSSGISLWMPFYIEKENNNYIFKCKTIPKGNDDNSIHLWLHFIHNHLLYTTGIISKGQFTFTDEEKNQKIRYKFDENGMFLKEKNYKDHSINRKEFIDYIDKYKDKETYTPKLFKYISEEIEQNNQLKNNYSFEP